MTSVANPSILIGQGFFLKEEHRPVEDEGDNLVEWDDLRPLTEYGWHLALSSKESVILHNHLYTKCAACRYFSKDSHCRGYIASTNGFDPHKANFVL